jgi:hypothetical protein
VTLGGVQGWQECAAALGRQFCKDRAQGFQFAIGHLIFQASVDFYRCPFLFTARALNTGKLWFDSDGAKAESSVQAVV